MGRLAFQVTTLLELLQYRRSEQFNKQIIEFFDCLLLLDAVGR